MSDKGKRGGKRANFALGYYGRNDAGDKMYFKGSASEEYTFSNSRLGSHTITARSYEDALRQAKALGYLAKDYKPRKRGKK